MISSLVPRGVRFIGAYLLFGGSVLFYTYFALLPMSLFGISVEKRRRVAVGGIRRYLHMLAARDLLLIEIEGTPAQGPIVRAFNHPTIFDALIVLVQDPTACCIVKPAVYTSWLYGYAARLLQYIPASSGPHILACATQELSLNRSIIFFPSGTRETHLTKLKRTAARLSAETATPIQVGIIQCVPTVLGKGSRWYEAPSSVISVTLHYLDPLLVSSNTRPLGIQSRELTKAMEMQIRECLARVPL